MAPNARLFSYAVQLILEIVRIYIPLHIFTLKQYFSTNLNINVA